MDETTEPEVQREEAEVSKPKMPQFLPKLRGQQVIIRLNDGRPLTGKLLAFNAYELLLDAGPKTFLVFKHSVASIEVPRGVLD
jgi:sRNA-binding regulator protein Hfq